MEKFTVKLYYGTPYSARQLDENGMPVDPLYKSRIILRIATVSKNTEFPFGFELAENFALNEENKAREMSIKVLNYLNGEE